MQWGFLFRAYRVSKKLLRAWQERRDGAGTWVRQGACWGLSPVTLGHRGVARAGVGVSSRGAWGGGAHLIHDVPLTWASGHGYTMLLRATAEGLSLWCLPKHVSIIPRGLDRSAPMGVPPGACQRCPPP